MFVNKLPIAEFDLFIADPHNPSSIDINIRSSKAKLSDDPASQPAIDNCWRYIRVGSKEDNNLPKEVFIGPVINVQRNVALTVNFANTLGSMTMMPGDGPMLDMPPINPRGMDPNMNPSVGVAVHLHGGKVQSNVDGWPLQPMSFSGNPYHDDNGNALQTALSYTYPNQQRASMLWFHDHGMDNTAPQVYAGLAGLYFIRDESDEELFDLLRGTILTAEIPLVIQDRILTDNATKFDYAAGFRMGRPEFLGDTILVNGREQPYHEVYPKRYRLRILNGSNARTYALALINPDDLSGQGNTWHSDKLTVIGNDAGLFASKKSLQANDYLVLASGERLDVILDLTEFPLQEIAKLRLINLAVGSLARNDSPEAIFQHEAVDGGSLFRPTNAGEFSTLLAINQANIMQFSLQQPATGEHHCQGIFHKWTAMASKARFMAKLDRLLRQYATDDDEYQGEDGFRWQAGSLDVVPPGHIAANRLLLLMNDTQKSASNPYTEEGKWHDTQIWEMDFPQAGSRVTPFQIPFDARLGAADAGSPAAMTAYQVRRSTFFVPNMAASDLITKNGPNFNKGYPTLQHDWKNPTSGTYERWYVANLGNWQPSDGAFTLPTPDMHPFHIHLVNFVVLHRFALDAAGNFSSAAVVGKNAFDHEVRHDTLRINSNELVELLVYFPPGFHGKYVYHCHLVEHEDMGMMLHFDV